VKIHIQHQTTYCYSENVQFTPHRVMLRPREGHDIQIERSMLEITPAHRTRWIRDVYGNSIAVIDFTESASQLSIQSELTLNYFDSNPFDFRLEPDAVQYPFAYDSKTGLELYGLTQPIYTADHEAVGRWLGLFWRQGQSLDTLQLLQRMNETINQTFRYQLRYEPGVQSPGETLSKKSGACRDFATLLIESCRWLGLAARFVSGYVAGDSQSGSGASTHAWSEVYLPGAGWRGFDPTSGMLTASRHVPVAVSRHPEEATPIAGSFIGTSNVFLSMNANVSATEMTRFESHL
jgi:transglutaminase-like putative cysteine protease